MTWFEIERRVRDGWDTCWLGWLRGTEYADHYEGRRYETADHARAAIRLVKRRRARNLYALRAEFRVIEVTRKVVE